MERFGVTKDQIREGRCDENYRRLLKFEVDRCQSIFDEGKVLLPMLKPAVRRHVAMFGKGGEAILEAIRRQNYDTLSHRPKLSKWQKGRLVAGATAAMLWEPVANLFARKEAG
jgi:phytoene/squalene synthetase